MDGPLTGQQHNNKMDMDIYYQNVRGLKTKLRTWRNSLLLLEHNLVAATETFLDASVNDSELACDNWSILRRDRSAPCGGVLLAAREPIVLRRHTELETDTGEDLWASFTWHGRCIYVCVVYIKPSAKDEQYMTWFCKLESFVNDLKGLILIFGDINLNSASKNINNYYCYFMSYCSLHEKNVVTNMYGGMLDIVLVQENILAREIKVRVTEGIVPPDAYHPPLDINVGINISRLSDRIEPCNIDSRKDWNFKNCNFSLLYDTLSQVLWDELYELESVYESTEFFYNTLYKIFDACVSKKRRMNSNFSRYPVWFTKEIIADTRLKLRLHTSWKRTNSEKAYKSFSNLRADLKARVNLAYQSYVSIIEQNIKTNPRAFWRHVSSLRSKGGFEPNVVYKGNALSGVQASEAFADFFSSVFLPELPKLDAHETSRRDLQRSSSHVDIHEITLKDVAYGIENLRTSGSIGPDHIPPWLLKDGKNVLMRPLCHLFNVALKCSTYPPQWKLSRVTPIPKSSNKTLVEDYRPIAILPTLAKVFERIIHGKLHRQIEPYLCNEQHGFRGRRSVNTNLLTLVDHISTKLDRGEQVDVLYFDFRKAFDRINNDVLLVKLSALGLAPGLLHFIADYLRDRQQYVRLGLYESRPYHTRSGVSQGSILGPLLFVLMVNDLPSVIKYAKCLLYADDLKLFLRIRTEEDCLMLQHDIDAVYQWGVENKMEFNTSKCFEMTFGRMRCPIEFNYKLDGTTIPRSSSIKDLGITFDRKLTFHTHITTVAKECYQRLGFVLRNCQDFNNIGVIKLIFSSLVRSKLEASACVWHPYESTYTLLLEKVQKAFLRYLYKRLFGYYPFMYPTKFLLGTLGYNSLEVRRHKDQLVTMLKILRGTIDAPDLSDQLCRVFAPNNYRRSRKHRLFSVPMCRTVARARSPIPRTLTALNALLDTSPNVDVFADEWRVILSECLKYCETNA